MPSMELAQTTTRSEDEEEEEDEEDEEAADEEVVVEVSERQIQAMSETAPAKACLRATTGRLRLDVHMLSVPCTRQRQGYD